MNCHTVWVCLLQDIRPWKGLRSNYFERRCVTGDDIAACSYSLSVITSSQMRPGHYRDFRIYGRQGYLDLSVAGGTAAVDCAAHRRSCDDGSGWLAGSDWSWPVLIVGTISWASVGFSFFWAQSPMALYAIVVVIRLSGDSLQHMRPRVLTGLAPFRHSESGIWL